MPFQNPIQMSTPKHDKNVSKAATETVDHLRRMRRVVRLNAKAPWKRNFCTRLPMILIVHEGCAIVRRDGQNHVAPMGNIVLLTPGSFEVTAVPLNAHGDICVSYAKFPLSALPRNFSDGASTERIVLDARVERERGVFVIGDLARKVVEDWQFLDGRLTLMQSVADTLLHSYSPAVFSFLRIIFFEKRWAFLKMMDLHAMRPFPVEHLASRYRAGRASFFRDCFTYTGHTPADWILRRKMDLAGAWLRAAKKSVPEVAALLHYEDVRRFRRAYRKHHGRYPEELLTIFPTSFSLGDEFFCLRPFWWPSPLRLLGEPPLRSWLYPESGGHPDEPPVPVEAPADPVEAPDGPCEEAPPDATSELPPADVGKKEPGRKSMEERFCSGELIPITEIIEFPTGLPELLKAA